MFNKRSRPKESSFATKAIMAAGTLVFSGFAFPLSAQCVQVENTSTPRVAVSRDIQVGQSVSSSLDPGKPFEEYRLRLAGGDSVRIDMVSPISRSAAATSATGDQPAGTRELDSFLELRRSGGQDPVAVDDDGGDEGLNSRLLFTAPLSGDYIIRARTFGSSASGDYVLTVVALPRAPTPIDLAGDQHEDDLGPNSPVMVIFDEPRRYALYWVNGEQGERIRLHARSDAQSLSLELLNSSGSTLATKRTVDPNVEIISVLPATGRYLVRVAVPSSQTAHYSLDVDRVHTRDRETSRLVRVGHDNIHELTLTSNFNPRPDGSGEADFFYKLYWLNVQANESVTVIVDAPGFDPIVEAGEVETLGFLPWVSVNSIAGRPARLVLRPFRTGTIYIRVRSDSLTIGSFRLRIVAGVAMPPV